MIGQKLRLIGGLLCLLSAFCTVGSANSFLDMTSPTFEFTVDGMEYKYDLDMFVQQKRRVWVPLGELWFLATPTYIEGGIDVIVEVEDENGNEYDFVMPNAGGSADFWVGGNHILVRSKIMHSNCFHGAHEVISEEEIKTEKLYR